MSSHSNHTVSAIGRAALEYMAERASRAFTAHDLADAVGVARPKMQGALAKLREHLGADLRIAEGGFVEHFPDHVGTWAITRLRRLRDARVGADTQNAGKYAVYFYDEHGNQIRSVGKFESVKDAAEGVYLIWAETLLEEVIDYWNDHQPWHEDDAA